MDGKRGWLLKETNAENCPTKSVEEEVIVMAIYNASSIVVRQCLLSITTYLTLQDVGRSMKRGNLLFSFLSLFSLLPFFQHFLVGPLNNSS